MIIVFLFLAGCLLPALVVGGLALIDFASKIYHKIRH